MAWTSTVLSGGEHLGEGVVPAGVGADGGPTIQWAQVRMRCNMSFSRLLSAVLLLASGTVFADDAIEQTIRARMAKLFPDDEVTAINQSPLTGLYEVMLGPSLFYMTGDGRHAVRGDIIDLESRQNISKERRAEARKLAFAELAVDEVIEFAPAKNPARAELYVYTDIDCGYCRKLHQEVPALNEAGIAIRYLAFPRAGLTGESYDKISAVWCAADRRSAMTAAKAGKGVEAPTCDNPVAEHFALGQAMGVGGTPAVFTPSGRELGGYIPAERLIKMLNDGQLR